MGCNESAVNIASNNTTGNPPCTGYELSASLDFDTGTAGDRTDDTYYDSGAGWDPIGGGAAAYTAKFDGVTHTISNLFIDRDTTRTGEKYYAGLFGRIDTGADIENVKLTGVSVTLENTTTEDPQPWVYAGGLVGYQKAGTITGSSVRGAVKAVVKPGNATTTTKAANAGGLVGYKEAGDVVSSYARASVTAEQTAQYGNLHANAGGLVGFHKAGNVTASYATGLVTAKVSHNDANAYAGGLVGEHEGGEIEAAYSYAIPKAAYSGSTTTPASISLYAAGFAAYQNGGNITASYSTGAPTIDKGSATTGVTEYKGGLVGRYASATTTNSYWDTELSGVTAAGQGTGKTRSQLTTPRYYGTGAADIYKDWNLDLDGTAGNDDPWDFGTISQHPVLKFGHTAADQRVTIRLSASPNAIWERALSTPSRVNSTTITATLSEALVNDVTVSLANDAAYTLSATTTTIAGGSLSANVTLTAVNNRVDAPNNGVKLDGLSSTTANDPRVSFTSANPTVLINDDDSLAAPGNLRTANQTATQFEVQWDRVSGDASYNLQYKLTTATTWTSAPNIPTSGCRVGLDTTKCHYVVTNTTAGLRYNVRVEAVASAAGVDNSPYATLIEGAGLDYDKDGDGFIEVSNLAQLNAIRWDLDADGEADSASDNTSYTTAYPSAAPTMGCPGSGCVGYELRADLDFNTDNSTPTATNPTGASSGDRYWNNGNGWDPIGTTNGASYAGGFDGNMDSDSTGDGGPYTISNLYQNWTSGNFVGLFAHLNSADDEVWHVALENVDITFDNSGSGTSADVYVGALAGHSETDIKRSYTTGTIEADAKITAAATYAYVGGLVGRLMDAEIESSYSWVDVEADASDSTDVTHVYAGGLVGLMGEVPLTNFPDTGVVASWAAGHVTAYAKSGTPDTGTAYAGGLVGAARRGSDITASYARGDVSATGATGNVYRGALAGYIVGTTNNQAPSEIDASFATGKLSGTTPADARCGLVGDRTDGAINDSYYDSDTLGLTGCDSTHGTPKTTVQLQSPTAYGSGIYANWNLDFNNDTNNDDPWDFGTSSQYPVLKYAGATRKLTARDQRPVVSIGVSPATIYEAVGGATSATLTATSSAPWNRDFVIALPAAADKLTIGGSNQAGGFLTFTSGSTGNWGTQQPATVKLASDPGTGKTVVVDFTRLSVNEPEVTPRYLTFTGGSSGNYNTAQTINVKFLAEPAAATTRVSITKNSSNVTTGYKVDLNAYRLAYDLSGPTITIPAGSTTGTVTLTAQNDYNDLADQSLTLALLAHPASTTGTNATTTRWVSKGATDPTLTITDDDELGQVTGVAAVQKTDANGNLASGATVSWTKVTGAAGYVVEWKTGTQIYDSARRLVAGDAASYDIPGGSLAPGATYDIRVYATKTGSDHGLPSDEISATYRGLLVFDKRAVTLAEPAGAGTTTGTYTVRLSVQPSSTTTVSIAYRTPQLIVTPSSITFNSTNWNQWQAFTVEADQFPPRGTGRNDRTQVTFNDNSTLDFEVNGRVFQHHGKITFRVKRKSSPGADDVVDLTTLPRLTVPSTHRIAVSTTTLTFTPQNWDTAQTVTLSTLADADSGVDEQEVFLHTAASAGGDYAGVYGRVTATQIDRNNAPTSEGFTHRVKPRSSSEHSDIRAGKYFPFYDEDGDTLSRVLIVSLPDPAQGELKLYRKEVSTYCRWFPSRARCQKVETPVAVDQHVVAYNNPTHKNSTMKFYPTSSFASTTFEFKVVDNRDNISDKTYTVTVLPEGSPPSLVANLTATGGDTEVELKWDASTDSTITRYLYRYQESGGHSSWSQWASVTAPVTANPASLTFSTTTWSTAQTAAVKLPAAPASGVRIGFAKSNVEFTPSTLTFTTQNWDTAQNVSVKLKAAPDAATTVTLSPADWANAAAFTITGLTNNTAYDFELRSENSGGLSRTAVANATPAPPPPPPNRTSGIAATVTSTGIALAWDNPNDATITKYQVRQLVREGNLTALPGNRQATLSWDNPHDANAVRNYQYRYKAGAGAYGGWTDMPTLTKSPSYTVTGLANDTKHTFQVRVIDSFPNDPLVPLKDVGAYKYGALGGNNKITLGWTTPSIGVTIIRWQYRQKTGTGNYGAWTDVPGSDGNTTSWETGALAAGTAYAFQVRPVLSGNAGGPTRQTWEFTAVAGGASQTITWADPNDDYVDSYQVRRSVRTGSNTPSTKWTGIAGSHAMTTSYGTGNLAAGSFYTFRIRSVMKRQLDDAAATPSTSGGWADISGSSTTTVAYSVPSPVRGKAYAFQVRAVNPSGPGPASEWVRAALLPAKPAGLTAAAGDASVALAWTAPTPADPTIDKWQYQKNAETGWSDICNARVSDSCWAATSYTVTGLTNGTAYTFTIRAVNETGNSPNATSTAAVTPLATPAAPAGFTATGRVRIRPAGLGRPGQRGDHRLRVPPGAAGERHDCVRQR